MEAALGSLGALRAALVSGDQTTLAALQAWQPAPQERDEAAALALRWGRPTLAARWAADPLTRAAAYLRLGQAAQALTELRGQPDTARPAVLRARAAWQAGQRDALSCARHARALARAEGDAAALVAAVTLLGEILLSEPKAALRALAEGLRVAELTGQEAEAHLLAVLAQAQAKLGSPTKAARTAAKALSRSLPGSPARVGALWVLGREEEARAEAAAGALGEGWWPAR
ncbi:hypothetical protein [Deinococcus sp. YIM 77859]|uniref:hypothetical protein n=1 Tax=Deinococcus sp. YIM 77859 TaxID=1540221 RepID=UPI0005505634|nr:hypothetical protein [Deinococcus sp. YIM 77859]